MLTGHVELGEHSVETLPAVTDAGSGGSMRAMGTGVLTVQLWNLKLALAYYDSCVQGGATIAGGFSLSS